MKTPQVEPIFWSQGKKFGAVLTASALADLVRHATAAGTLETGGILMGRYNDQHSCATIDHVSGPPIDSEQGRSTFVRGVKGLGSIVARLWAKERRYYLGEWHYHPGASPTPTHTDLTSMVEIARDSKYACPEPILLIIGGKPPTNWELRLQVTSSNGTHVELHGEANELHE